MIDKKIAEEARDHVLGAIARLNQSLLLVEGNFPNETYEQMKRAIGQAIGTLDTGYLAHIYKIHSDLDDLRD